MQKENDCEIEIHKNCEPVKKKRKKYHAEWKKLWDAVDSETQNHDQNDNEGIKQRLANENYIAKNSDEDQMFERFKSRDKKVIRKKTTSEGFIGDCKDFKLHENLFSKKNTVKSSKETLSSSGCKIIKRSPEFRTSKLTFRQQEEKASFSEEIVEIKSIQTSHLSVCNQLENQHNEANNGNSDSEIDESIYLEAIPSPVSLVEECSEGLNKNRREVSVAKPFSFQENIIAGNTTVIKPKSLRFKKSARKVVMSEKEKALARQSEILKIEFKETKSQMNIVRFYKSSDDGKIYGIFPVPVNVCEDHEKIIVFRVFHFSRESITTFQQEYLFAKEDSQ